MANRDDELLHRVAGAIEVARHMVERSAGLYRRSTYGSDLDVSVALFDAADALDAVTVALDVQLRARDLVGPAA
jgi:hypothetical protein